jgi:signal transduction histidine kinase
LPQTPAENIDEEALWLTMADLHAHGSAIPPIPEDIRHRYRAALINNTPDLIIVLSQYFQVLELNPAALNALATTRTTTVGRPCSEVLRCRNLNRVELCGTSSCPLRRVLGGKHPLPNEELIIGTMPERICEVSTSVTPIDAGYGWSAVFLARDMSSLNVANRVRSNFVSMVSHELRTPLNSVHGFIELLLEGHMGKLNEEQQLYLGYTREGVQQLVSIVEDILFMTRSDLGQFQVKQQVVPLTSLIEQILTNMQPQATKAEVTLVQEITAPKLRLYADPQRVKQVLNNLLANAFKFTPPGGTVTVRAEQQDEKFARISVTDTGYGIPVEDRPHIFERFYQSNHSEQSTMGGYGLGLSIARLIVEQHSGTISFDTTLNKGTTFYFTLPLHVEA